MTDKHRGMVDSVFMDAQTENLAGSLRLDRYDSVREHVQSRLEEEVRQLEMRISTLRQTPSPHSAIIIATYERMIERKRGFMRRWGMMEPQMAKGFEIA